MPLSKFDSKREFNENKWVITLINTKTELEGLWGGHAKIVVEGVKKNQSGRHFDTELFIAEYHIMEAERVPQESWIPQMLRNTKCKYSVLMKEGNEYNERQEQQYSEVRSQSWDTTPGAVTDMINDIKEEQRQVLTGEKESDFQ